MKQAEKRRTLVREWKELRAADGSLVASGEDGDFGFVGASERVVRVRRYRLERPVVLEVRTTGDDTCETEYRIVGDNHDGEGDAIAGVFGGRWNTWDVWARAEDGAHELEDSVEGYAAAERYARSTLRDAGYRVKRAKS